MAPAMARLRDGDWLERLSALPIVGTLARRFDPAFLRFGVVGAAGFAVDYGVLHAMVAFAGVGPYVGRFVSFPVAVLATWLLNRTFTFRQPTAHGPLRQAMVYAAVQGAGGVVNIAVYSAALALVPSLKDLLIVPLACGSAAGLCLTFLGAKHIAFKPARAVETVEAVETGR
jgi:putative flippase GtrA